MKRFARRRRSLVAAALYVCLSVLATWPLLPNAASQLPRGSEPVATVPFVSAWALWWTSDRAAHDFSGYWQAPIFYPSADTFALSEPMPLAGLLVTPWLWLGMPLALAYNLFLLGSLSLNGLAAFWLLASLRLTFVAALGGGALVCLLPVVHHQLGVLTLVPLWGLLFTLHAALRLLRAPSLKQGLALGAAMAATYLLCAQYGLLLAIALGPALLMAAGKRALRRRFLVAAVAALLALAAAIAPVALTQLRVRKEQELTHSTQQVKRGGALLRSYWRSPPNPLPTWPGLRIDQSSGTALYPGSLRLALALGAFIPAAADLLQTRRRRKRRTSAARRRVSLFFAVLVVLEFLISVSPHLHAFGMSLRDGIAGIVPGVSQIRSLWRAGVVAQLCVALLAAHGLHWLQLRAAHSKPWRTWLVAGIAVLATCEVWPPAQALSPVPAVSANAGWAQFVRRELAADEPYCVLPWVESGSVRAFEDVSRFMLLTALHGRPMINGYSSYFPAVHERIAKRWPRFGDPATAKLLLGYGVRYAVVRSSAVDARSAGTWRRVFADLAADVSIYRLPDAASTSPRPTPLDNRNGARSRGP